MIRFDQEAEESALGAVLLTPEVLPTLAGNGLRPSDFYLEHHQAIYRAMLALHDRQAAIDEHTVYAELRNGGVQVERHVVEALMAAAPVAGNAPEYARIVQELSTWRRRLLGAIALSEGIEFQDEDRFASALAKLENAGQRLGERSYTPTQLAEELYAWLEAGGGETFPTPWPDWNDRLLGGLRRGQVMLIGGHSSHGKSVVLDQILEHAAKAGARTHLYINEMTPLERSARTIARRAKVPVGAIARAQLDPQQQERVVKHIEEMPFGVTDCAGWSALEVARHFRGRRLDVVGLDILHLIPHRDEADLREISGVLNRAAKQADVAVVATVHLNESRVVGIERPAPTLGDIRGSGMLKNDADIVGFVWREQNELGRPLESARLYLAKVRMGELGGFEAYFWGQTMQFTEA